MRKAFNFYRSYWEVANELSDKDRLAFYDALLKRQFTGQETDLKGLVKFAYLSQKHSIDRQVKGFEDKTKSTLIDPTEGGAEGSTQHPYQQVKEKEKEEVKENIYRQFKHLSITKDEYNKLIGVYSSEAVNSILDAIENYKNNKNYTSLYLTAKQWLKKEASASTKQQKSNDQLFYENVMKQVNAYK
jgi:hypothetical protein